MSSTKTNVLDKGRIGYNNFDKHVWSQNATTDRSTVIQFTLENSFLHDLEKASCSEVCGLSSCAVSSSDTSVTG